jgi:subtilase-type serine protease
MTNLNAGKRRNLLMSVAWRAALACAVTSPAMAITSQDDIPPSDLVDVDNTYSNVAGVAILAPLSATTRGLFVCSGTLVNPRTVFTATHCVANNFGGSEVYTENGPLRIGITLDPLFGTGVNTPTGGVGGYRQWRDFNTGMNNVTDVIMPAGAEVPGAFSFPDLDFTMLALGTPVGDVQGAPILLSPLTQEFVATMVGYGTVGNGTIPSQGLDFRRRSAQNVVQYLGTFEDFDDDTFGADDYGDSSQMLYFIDFDYLGRTAFFDSPGPGIDYDSLAGDALYNADDPTKTEGNTAGGDSGGPLFASINGADYLAGTLSGGLTIWVNDAGAPLFGYYGTQTYWNPLFKYADFIIANNPYKYVEARRGNGNWTDPGHWEQTLDPNYVVLDRHGNPVNGVPRSTPDDEAVKFGTFRNIFDIFDGGDGLPDAASLTDFRLQADADSLLLTAEGGYGGGAGGGTVTRPDTLKGPGSRNFVPNNTDGVVGLAGANPAQYFDVTLRYSGSTRIRKNESIEIDHLTLYGDDVGLDLDYKGALTVNLETELVVGRFDIDGTLTTRTLINTFGLIEGAGVINASNGVFNLGGIISPGEDDVGTLTVNGDFTQATYGWMVMDIGKSRNDTLVVNGHADIAGSLAVRSTRRLRYGERFTIVDANSLTGNFESVLGSGTLLYGSAVADADSIDLVIDAHRLAKFHPRDTEWGSLAEAIDFARDYHYLQLTALFDVIDYVSLDAMNFVLPTLTPINAFEQVPLAVDYQQGFTTGLAARTAELRSGQRGISERSLLAGYRMLQSDATAGEEGAALSRSSSAPANMGDRFGLFISGRGSLTDIGDEAYNGDRFDPASISALSSAELTVGADYRVTENFAIGVASTMSRYVAHMNETTPLDHSGYGVMLYASTWKGDAFLDSYVGVARQDYAISRTPGMSAAQTTSAAPGAVQTLAGVRAGWTFEPVAGLKLGPTLSVNHSQLRLDGYSETGGGAFALDVEARTLSSTTIEQALEFTYQPVEFGRAKPYGAYGRVGVAQEVGDGADIVSARFAAAPDVAFDIERTLDRYWVTAATGLSYRFDRATSAYLEANSDMGRGELSNESIMLGFNRAF